MLTELLIAMVVVVALNSQKLEAVDVQKAKASQSSAEVLEYHGIGKTVACKQHLEQDNKISISC